MTNSKEEQRKTVANKAFRAEQFRREAAQRVVDQESRTLAVQQKIARLRGLRLAHEAQMDAAAPAVVTPAPKKSRKAAVPT